MAGSSGQGCLGLRRRHDSGAIEFHHHAEHLGVAYKHLLDVLEGDIFGEVTPAHLVGELRNLDDSVIRCRCSYGLDDVLPHGSRKIDKHVVGYMRSEALSLTRAYANSPGMQSKFNILVLVSMG